MEKVINKYKSFEAEENAEIKYWKSIPPVKRIEFLEIINSRYGELKNVHKQGLQRVYRIIKQTQS